MNRFVSNFTGVDNPSAFDTAYTLLVTGGGFVSVAFLIAWSVYVFGVTALGVLLALLFFVWAFLRGATCQHQNVAWPQRNRRRCIDCGKSQFYVIGGTAGKWERR